MTGLLRHKNDRQGEGTLRAYRAAVTTISFDASFAPPRVTLESGEEGIGSCLGCHDAPCMSKEEADFDLPSILKSFPGDPSTNVCPTDAIHWDEEAHSAFVYEAACIGCGLCVVRCPYGAIRLSSDGKAIVETVESPLIARGMAFDTHVQPTRTGQIAPSTAEHLSTLPAAIDTMRPDAGTFVRNVMHEIGVQMRPRRRGDTNVRMDGVASFADGRLSVVEIEFSNAVLESPRALVEDVAVLHARYNIPVASVDPLSIVLTLPSSRSDYYHVIDDIGRVLQLSCRTLSFGTMLLLMWRFTKLSSLQPSLFTTRAGNIDLSASLRALGCEQLSEYEPYEGSFRPSK